MLPGPSRCLTLKVAGSKILENTMILILGSTPCLLLIVLAPEEQALLFPAQLLLLCPPADGLAFQRPRP